MLNLKPKPLAWLKVKEIVEEVVEEVVEETYEQYSNTIEIIDRIDGTRIAKGPDWEMWVEPLNYVLKEGSHYSYFSNFEALLDRLKESRTKFWITQEKYNHIEIALTSLKEDMEFITRKIMANLVYLNQKYNIHGTD